MYYKREKILTNELNKVYFFFKKKKYFNDEEHKNQKNFGVAIKIKDIVYETVTHHKKSTNNLQNRD